MKGYRTLIVNFLSGLIAVLEMEGWLDIIPPEYQSHFALALAIANMALRLITNTPVGRAQ
jgi:hypothetical protein